ncbi:MAG TPA: Zn-dependent alcohol dehydrogenase [Aggregatilineales bacterium]|nr:Zn-dependent alcohol dehydrogenase [Aggregatilineales bacterium]
MLIQTRGLVLDRPHTPPVIENVTVADPGPGEVRVRLVASGICHTDISAVRDARFWPLLLGHEGAGIVDSVGAGVSHVQPGDPVMISWRVACGHCDRCQQGRQDLCESVQTTAQPRVHRASGERLHAMLNAGTFCEYAVVPADGAIPIRRHMPLETAALVGCAVATGIGAVLHTARVQPGQSVAVFGAGGVGLNVVQGARLALAGLIVAVDRVESKLRSAKAMGATHGIRAGEGDPLKTILELTGGRGVDHAFEVVGHPEVMAQALEILAPGGKLTLVGAAARDAVLSFRPRAFMSKQQTIQGCIYGSCRPPVDFPLFVDWYMKGQLRIDELLTGAITLDELPSFFETETPPQAIRTIVKFGQVPS